MADRDRRCGDDIYQFLLSELTLSDDGLVFVVLRKETLFPFEIGKGVMVHFGHNFRKTIVLQL